MPAGSVLGLAAALAVLGLGWNLGLVSGTSILSGLPLAVRARTQGAVDLCIAVAGSGAGLGSGFVVTGASYGFLAAAGGLLALAIVPIVAVAVDAERLAVDADQPVEAGLAERGAATR